MLCSPRRLRAIGSAAVLAGLAFGCANEVSSNLENKRCSANRSCLLGYVCNAAEICVPQALAAGDAAPDEAPHAASPSRTRALSPLLERPSMQLPEMTHDAGATQRDENDAGACRNGLVACGDGCVDLARDSQNCGGCAQVCGAPVSSVAICAWGACDFLCENGFTRCGDACVDLASNGSHCGACGRVCPSAASCERGECTPVCSANLVVCSGACVDPKGDPNNCGSCGNACSAPSGKHPTCMAGSCAPACPMNQSLCAEKCVNLETDMNNCGACGKACNEHQHCTASRCTGAEAANGS